MREIGRKFSTPNYNIVTPGTVSPIRTVPSHIVKPPYITQGMICVFGTICGLLIDFHSCIRDQVTF